jgi:large-conductance mechanosensitive channel
LKGAIVFIVAFLLFLVITLGYSDLPPGKMIYNAVVGDVTTDYPVFGIGASALVSAVFNGVFYGVIIWIIYSLAERMMKKEPKKNVQSQAPQPQSPQTPA